MNYFNIVAETNENTVVTMYEPMPQSFQAYQSEAALEKDFNFGEEIKTVKLRIDVNNNLKGILNELLDPQKKFTQTKQ